MVQIKKVFTGIWAYLQEACGENDYERYRACVLGRGDSPLPPDKFYLLKLRRKYSTISRCC
jgi:hypothetical protein